MRGTASGLTPRQANHVTPENLRKLENYQVSFSEVGYS